MTANEWLGVMKQASDFPKGMEKLILKYGEMLIAEHESKVKKLTIPDVSNSVCSCGSLNYGYGFAKCYDCGKIKDI